MPNPTDIITWTERFGHSKLRSFTDEEGHFWLQQNAKKASKWAKFAREGHTISWEFDGPGGSYTGQMLVDGTVMTSAEATKKLSKE